MAANDDDHCQGQRPRRKRPRSTATSDGKSTSTLQDDQVASGLSMSAEDPHVTSHSDVYGTYFTSPWSTEFLLTVPSEQQWRGREVYIETPTNANARYTDEAITVLPIVNLAAGNHLLRVVRGPRPLWYFVRSTTTLGEASAATPQIDAQEALAIIPESPAPIDEDPGSMTAPAEALYASGELALAAAKQFALEHGYKLNVSRSRGKGQHKEWMLHCYRARGAASMEEGDDEGDRENKLDESRRSHDCCSSSSPSGEEGNSAATSLKSALTSTSCPFAVAIQPHNGQWQLKILNGQHRGHDADSNLLPAQANLLSSEEKQLIKRLWSQDAQIKPARILDFINDKRKESAKPAVPSSRPIRKQLGMLRAKKGVNNEEATGEARRSVEEEEEAEEMKPSKELTSVEARCAQDFAKALVGYGSFRSLPDDHGVRINAAAQLYLAEDSICQGGPAKVDQAHVCGHCKQPGHNRRSCPQLRRAGSGSVGDVVGS